MRILISNHNVAWRGGTFFRAYHFGRHLALRGHEVTLLTTSRTRRRGFSDTVVNGVRVVEAPDLFWGRGRTGWDPWNTTQRIRLIRRQQFDVIHVFDSRPAAVLPAVWHRRRYGTRVVLDWADWWGRGGTNSERPGRLLNMAIAPVETFFEEAYRPSADANTVISHALYGRAISLGVRAERLLRLMQGSDVDGIRPLDQSATRVRLGLPENTMLIGHVGVLQSRDARFLFTALDLLRRDWPKCRLVVIGRHSCDLRRYRETRSGWFETGEVSYEDLVSYIAASDVLLLPLADSVANRARWPSRVNDYLAAGRPIVTTDVGDVAKLMRESDAGVVTHAEPEGFAAGVSALLQDRELRAACGRRGRAVAETQLAWPIVTNTLEEFYMKLM